MNTGNESIEAIMRRKRILFAGFVARMEDETTEVRDVRRTADNGGADYVGGQEKEWMVIGCLLNNLGAFGINANQWTAAAQDESEWRQYGGTRGGTF